MSHARTTRRAVVTLGVRPGDEVVWFEKIHGRKLRVAHRGTVVSTMAGLVIRDFAFGQFMRASARSAVKA